MLDAASSKNRRIVVIIQYDWCVQGYTRDLTHYLANEGYSVTFFVDKTSMQYGLIDTDTFQKRNIDMIELSERKAGATALWQRAKNRGRRELLIHLNNPLWLFEHDDFEQVAEWVRAHKHEVLCLIGIEKLGLIFFRLNRK
jgi:hypothetical protein